MNFLALMIVTCCLIAGCVHRPPPQPVAIQQANDANLSCEQISVDYTANTEIAKNKIAKNNLRMSTMRCGLYLSGPGWRIFRTPMAMRETRYSIAISSFEE